MTSFQSTARLFGPGIFSRTSFRSLDEDMGFYFRDTALAPLFIQVRHLVGSPEAELKRPGELPVVHSRAVEQHARWAVEVHEAVADYVQRGGIAIGR